MVVVPRIETPEKPKIPINEAYGLTVGGKIAFTVKRRLPDGSFSEKQEMPLDQAIRMTINSVYKKDLQRGSVLVLSDGQGTVFQVGMQTETAKSILAALASAKPEQIANPIQFQIDKVVNKKNEKGGAMNVVNLYDPESGYRIVHTKGMRDKPLDELLEAARSVVDQARNVRAEREATLVTETDIADPIFDDELKAEIAAVSNSNTKLKAG